MRGQFAFHQFHLTLRLGHGRGLGFHLALCLFHLLVSQCHGRFLLCHLQLQQRHGLFLCGHLPFRLLHRLRLNSHLYFRLAHGFGLLGHLAFHLGHGSRFSFADFFFIRHRRFGKAFGLHWLRGYHHPGRGERFHRFRCPRNGGRLSKAHVHRRLNHGPGR